MSLCDCLECFTNRQEEATAAKRGKDRGLAFVGLFTAAKQLVDAYPTKYPYLQYEVRKIEEQKLLPPIKL